MWDFIRHQKGSAGMTDICNFGGKKMIRLTAKLTTNPVNQCGLVAGAIGGESIVLLVLVNAIILKNSAVGSLYGESVFLNLWNLIYPFLIIAIFEGWGVFAAWMGKGGLKNRIDALFTGIIAGMMMGILLEVMWLADILNMLSHELGQYYGAFFGYGNTALIIGSLVIFAVMGAVLSGFGAYIFYEAGEPQQTIPAL